MNQKYIFAPLLGYSSFANCKRRKKKEAICNSLWIERLLYYPPDTLRFINQRHCFSLKTPSTLGAFGAKNLTYGGKRRLRHENSQELCGGTLIHGPEIKRARALVRQRKKEKTAAPTNDTFLVAFFHLTANSSGIYLIFNSKFGCALKIKYAWGWRRRSEM
jgi:hypothetical protein